MSSVFGSGAVSWNWAVSIFIASMAFSFEGVWKMENCNFPLFLIVYSTIRLNYSGHLRPKRKQMQETRYLNLENIMKTCQNTDDFPNEPQKSNG